MTAKKVLKKIGKVILWLLVFVLVVIVAAFTFLSTNYARRLIRDKAQVYLQNKLHTKVVIGSVDFSLPEWIAINNIYIEDQHKDTLLSGSRLAVEIDMLKLIHSEIFIRNIKLDNIYAHIAR